MTHENIEKKSERELDCAIVLAEQNSKKAERFWREVAEYTPEEEPIAWIEYCEAERFRRDCLRNRWKKS